MGNLVWIVMSVWITVLVMILLLLAAEGERNDEERIRVWRERDGGTQ